MTILETDIHSIDEYIVNVRQLTRSWYLPTGITPWFRGQSDEYKEAVPSIFRDHYKEHDMTTFFIQRAGVYSEHGTPKSPAQWLSLMQHVGLPTRLLDWSESALTGLFFSLIHKSDYDGSVYILHPMELNKLSKIDVLPASDEEPVINSYKSAYMDVNANIVPIYPIAVLPTHVHTRMAVQRSVFTINGKDARSFNKLFQDHSFSDNNFIHKFIIKKECIKEIKRDLGLLGIMYSTVFPDLDGLAKEILQKFS